jgi:uncharacterized membrane protein
VIPSTLPGNALTTLLQYAAGVGIVALGCLPLLEIDPVRTRLERWPTDRLAVNYLSLAVAVAAGQWAVVLLGWQVLQIGSTQADPQFRAGRLFALLVGYPIAVACAGIVWDRSSATEQRLTPRAIVGLGVTVVFYVVTALGAALVVTVVALFTALPT